MKTKFSESKVFIILLIGLFLIVLIPLVNAEEFGYNYLDGELNVAQAINYTLVSVNDSDLWGGNAWSDTRWLNIDGGNANQDISIGIYDFTANDGYFDEINTTHLRGNLGGAIDMAGDPWTLSEVDFKIVKDLQVDGDIHSIGTGSWFNQTLLISGDHPVSTNSDATLVIGSEVNYISCINLTEGGNLGFQICYDGTGGGELVIKNMNGGTEYMTIDRDSGGMVFHNETEFVNITVTNITTTIIDTSGISGRTAGLFDLRGDPWILSGANLEVIGNVTASNFFGTFTGNSSIWSRAGTKIFPTNTGDEISGDMYYDIIIDASGNGDYTDIATATATEPAYTTFFIKDGTYTLTGHISLKEGQQLIGESKMGTILDQDETAYSIYPANRNVLKRFSLINGRSGGGQIYLVGDSNCILEELYIDSGVAYTSVPNYGSAIKMTSSSFDNYINNVELIGWHYGVEISSGCNRNKISNSYASGCQYGFRMRSANYTMLSNLMSIDNVNGIYCRESSYGVFSNIVVDVTGYGIYFYQHGNSEFNVITNYAGSAGTALFAPGTAQNNIFIGVNFASNSLAIGGDSNVFSGCAFDDITTSATADGTVLSGNSFATLIDGGTNTITSGNFFTNPTNILNQIGSVGIGTTNPQNLFNVGGDGNFTENLYVGENITLGQKITFAFGETIDNIVDGWVRITGGLKVVGHFNQTSGNATFNGYYGGMYFHDDAGVAVSWNDTYQIVPFVNATNLNGFDWIDNNKLMNTNGNGLYQVIWRVVGTGTNNHIYHGIIFVNEVEQENTLGYSIGQASNEFQFGSHGFIYLNTYDNVTLRGKDVGDTTNAEAIFANVNLVRVGN